MYKAWARRNGNRMFISVYILWYCVSSSLCYVKSSCCWHLKTSTAWLSVKPIPGNPIAAEVSLRRIKIFDTGIIIEVDLIFLLTCRSVPQLRAVAAKLNVTLRSIVTRKGEGMRGPGPFYPQKINVEFTVSSVCGFIAFFTLLGPDFSLFWSRSFAS